MSHNKIIYTSLILEIASLASILSGRNFIYVVLFFLLHSAASFLISTILIQFIPKRYRYNKLLTLTFFTTVNTIAFLIGYILSFYFVVFMLRKIQPKLSYKTETLSFPSVLTYPLTKRNLGEGVLKETTISSSMLKTRIINKLSYEISNISVGLLKTYINDPDYEIRMFAFQKLSHIKNTLISQINNLLNVLEKNPDDFLSLTKIAKLYWEIYTLGISDEALRNFYLSQIQYYIKKASSIAEDGELLFIEANILKDQQRYEEALELLEKSIKYGASPQIVLPVIAEIYYQKGDYNNVRKTFLRDETLRYDLTIGSLIETWLTI